MIIPDKNKPEKIAIHAVDHLLEKGSGSVNEDTLFMDTDIFGVFDGATSIAGIQPSCSSTGGQIAASTACSLFSKNCHPLPLLAKNANRAIHDRMVDYGVDCSRREALWSTSAAVVRIKGDRLEWLQTGDAYVILIYSDNSHKALVHQEDHDYETLMQWKSVAPASTLPIHEALKDQIRKVRCRMNRSYGVLNGETDAEHFFRWGSISLDNVREVLLFTDGLSIPSPTPTRYKNFDTLVARYFDLGLTGLKNHIRFIEQSDPGCKKLPRFKCHDDIAAISIKLTPMQPLQSATAA